jgi:hypothetical protein
MAEITGKLLSDLRPDGRVRIVFLAGEGTGDEPAFTVNDLDTAEVEFVRTLGLPPERAAELRALLERNKVFCVEATLLDAVAAMFRCI